MKLTTVIACATCLALLVYIATGCQGPDAAGNFSLGLGGFSVSSIPDPVLGHAAASAFTLTVAAQDGAAQTVAVTVCARDAVDARAAYLRVSFDLARFTLQRTATGPGLRRLCPQGDLLALYKLTAPGVVECGQVLPNWDRRHGCSGDAELATLYFRRQPSPAELKSACQPPDLDQSKATLTFDGIDTLQWRFYSQGDYNQNGIVDVGDLTPLGVHYSQTVTYPAQVDTALAVTDGNPDGVISLSDLAPIGINYGKNIGGGWNIYSSNSTADYPIHWNDSNGSAVGQGNLAVNAYHAITDPAVDRVLYMFAIPAPIPGDIYWVRPVDSDGIEGIASNYAPAGNNSPYAVFTTHGGVGDGTTGTAPHCVYFDATASFDPDGNPIVSYAWDFENDGFVDDTTATPLHTFLAPGAYTVKLTVSDGVLPGDTTLAIQVNDPGTWHVQTLDAMGDAGQNCSLAAIGGLPAIAYRQSSPPNTYAMFMQSATLHGDPGDWSSSTIAAVGDIRGISLAEVNGLPAIAYYDVASSPQFVAYSRYDGSAWLPSPPLDTDNNAGAYCNLLVYDGQPRICYYQLSTIGEGQLRLLSAGENLGATWPFAPAVLDGGLPGMNVGQFASAVARPTNIAAAYYDAAGLTLRYVRSNDPVLSGWTARIPDPRAGWDTGQGASLAIVNGNPCIAYYAQTAGPPAQATICFIRAEDAMGDYWPASPDTLPMTGSPDLSLASIDGQPAIAYRSTGGTLEYIRSCSYDSFGSGVMLSVDLGADVGRYVCLREIGGRPCIAYYDSTNNDLKFAIRY